MLTTEPARASGSQADTVADRRGAALSVPGLIGAVGKSSFADVGSLLVPQPVPSSPVEMCFVLPCGSTYVILSELVFPVVNAGVSVPAPDN